MARRRPEDAVERVLAPDGRRYSRELNDQLNELVLGTFSGEGPGERCLAYLESITTRRVLQPTASDQELRHLEGGRWLVYVIRQRMAQARETRSLAARGEGDELSRDGGGPPGEPDGETA
jgi:hypothetical protein